MKLAMNIKRPLDIGYQLILNESYWVLGINLLCKEKVLIKKRFENAVKINSQLEEMELVNQVFIESIANGVNSHLMKK
jgi:CRISPR/Cas system-associated protein Cas7 (RAMP superfamily)